MKADQYGTGKMRIAAIVSIFPKLSETFVLHQITGLIDLGHEVTVIAGINPKEKKVHPDFLKYNLKYRSYWLPKNKLWRYLKALPLFLLYFFRYPTHLLRSLNFFKYGKDSVSLRIFYCLIPFFQNEPFDIIYCHFGENGNIGAILKQIGIPGKLASTFYGRDITYKIKKFGKNYYHLLFEEADLLLPVCSYYKEILANLKINSNVIVVHKMGIDPERFQFKVRQSHLINSPLKILTICRLVEKKGLEYSIKAIHHGLVQNEINQEIHYNIVGEGPLRGSLESLVKKLQMADYIRLPGAMNQEEIKNIISESDIFILSCITAKDGDQDAIPLVLMEAMASGLPVISTSVSGIPELIKDGYNGFLVPEKNIEKLHERLAYLVKHPEIWPDIGKAARKEIEIHHNVRELNRQLARTFESLITEELDSVRYREEEAHLSA